MMKPSKYNIFIYSIVFVSMILTMGICFSFFYFLDESHNMNYIYLAILTGISLNGINLFTSLPYFTNDVVNSQNFKFYNLINSSVSFMPIISTYLFYLFVDNTDSGLQLQTHNYSLSEVASYTIFILCFITIIKIKKTPTGSSM